MITLVLTACPVALRGYLSRWLTEISPGVLVGKVSYRVREEIWQTVVAHMMHGRAVMIYPDSRSEQGFRVMSSNCDWKLVDSDGIALVKRPHTADTTNVKRGWSKASRWRRK